MGSLYGGYGQQALGRSQYGAIGPAVEPVVEPRFNMSVPEDEASGVAQNRWVVFEVYYYLTSYPGAVQHAHWGLCPAVKLEVSLDGGLNFVTVFDPENMATDAPGYTARVRVKSGQIIWGIIQKNTGWPSGREIVCRYTGPDEFGQEATKEVPVRWE